MDPKDYPEPEPHDEDIMPLATGNFEREIKKAFMIIIFFWKPGCDKCAKMKPEFVNNKALSPISSPDLNR